MIYEEESYLIRKCLFEIPWRSARHSSKSWSGASGY